MRQSIAFGCGLVLATLSVAASPARAQTVAVGPYYATPSLDQTLSCDTTANCPQFIVLSNMGNAAVLDRETGLVWEKSPNPLFDQGGAQVQCNLKSVGGRSGWHLPTLQQLQSLGIGSPVGSFQLLALDIARPLEQVSQIRPATQKAVGLVGDSYRLYVVLCPAD